VFVWNRALMNIDPMQVSKTIPATTTASSQTTSALATSPNGMLNMVFTANTSTSDLLYMFSKDNGATWSDNYPISGQASKTAPSLCVAKDGTLCVAYVAYTADNRLWYTSSKDNGATWSNASLVSGQASKTAPTLTIGENGTLHLVLRQMMIVLALCICPPRIMARPGTTRTLRDCRVSLHLL